MYFLCFGVDNKGVNATYTRMLDASNSDSIEKPNDMPYDMSNLKKNKSHDLVWHVSTISWN